MSSAYLARGRLAAGAALAGALCAAHGAWAGPAPPFPALLKQALAASPTLAQGEAEVDQAKGLAVQAQARPNPTASLLVENIAGSRSYADLGGQTTLQVDQALELGGKRAIRSAVAEASVEVSRAQQAQRRAAFAADLAQAYVAAEAATQRVTLSDEALALAREDQRVAKALVNAGKEAGLRVVQADADAAAAQADVDSAKAAETAAFLTLTALANASEPITSMPVSLLGRTTDALPPGSVETSPTYQVALAEREAAARKVRLERVQATPNLTVSAGVRQIGRDDVAAVVGLSMPIPAFDQNRGNIAAAQAGLRAAQARVAAVELELQAGTRSALARAAAGSARLSAVGQALAAADESYRLARLGYAEGKLPLIEVTAARRAVSTAKGQALDARLARFSALVDLARLSGQTLFGEQP